LKSGAHGHLNDFLSLFTDAFAESEFGVVNKGAFTNEDALDFQQFFNDSSVTNKVLASYSCAVSGGVAQVSAAINLQTQSRIVTENFDMGFIQTNGIWKIYRWQ
jgi:hypothetical protein